MEDSMLSMKLASQTAAHHSAGESLLVIQYILRKFSLPNESKAIEFKAMRLSSFRQASVCKFN